MHFLKLVTDGQMSNLFSTYCNLNEDTKNHGILGVWQPPTRRWRKQKHILYLSKRQALVTITIILLLYIYIYMYIYLYTNQVVNSKSLFWIFLGAYQIRPSAPGIPQQGVAWQSRQEARPADDIIGIHWLHVWERLQETIGFFNQI